MAFYHLQPFLNNFSLIHRLALELISIDDPDIINDNEEDNGNEEDEVSDDNILNDDIRKAIEKINLESKESSLDNVGLVKGGEVIKVIWERMMKTSGDPIAQQVYNRLLLHASQPYAEMLHKWTTSGDLNDPYDELLVKEAKSISNKGLDMDYTDEYWERRYTLRDGSSVEKPFKPDQAFDNEGNLKRLAGGACIPPFLESWKFKILYAGKYLNVIRECGIEIAKNSNKSPFDDKLVFNGMNHVNFYKQVEDAYTHANRALLKLLLDDEKLIERLRSMKHYFFLSNSDFFVHFLDQSYSELRKPAKSANLVKLQSLLDITLRNPASPSHADPYKEDVKISMSREPLYQWLLNVVNVSGAIGSEDNFNSKSKQVDDSKPIRGQFYYYYYY